MADYKTQRHRGKVFPKHRGTEAQRKGFPETQRHRGTEERFSRNTELQRHRGANSIETQRHGDTEVEVELKRRGSETQRIMESYNEITEKIIGAAIEVHRELGPGLLESVYEECMEYELVQQNLWVKRQVAVPVVYKGKALNKVFYMDLLVNDLVPVELKSVEFLLPVHEVQLVTYLKLSGKKLGLLLNFNVEIMRKGIRRKINGEI